MKFEAHHGIATVTMPVPTFIGCTSKAGIKQLNPPPLNAAVTGHRFGIQQDDWGTMVYDYHDEALRSPRSARYCHFFWHRDKLVLCEGLDRRRLNYNFEINSSLGLLYINRRPTCVYHVFGHADLGEPHKKVGIFHLLKFLEGGMNLEALNKCAIA